MKLPYPKSWDKTPLVVTITDGIDENGSPEVVGTYTGLCNYQGTTKTIRAPDGQFINLGGTLTIKGDIAPEHPAIQGCVNIFGRPRNIHSSEKPLNPDGSVHHTRLDLL